jgi:hypothetical protein
VKGPSNSQVWTLKRASTSKREKGEEKQKEKRKEKEVGGKTRKMIVVYL